MHDKIRDYEIRSLFTKIACIMVDASVMALVCRTDDGWGIKARYQKLLNAHRSQANFSRVSTEQLKFDANQMSALLDDPDSQVSRRNSF